MNPGGTTSGAKVTNSTHREIVRARPSDVVHVVHARPLGREIRTLEMEPEYARLPIDRGVDRIQRQSHFFRTVGYERRQ
jgi:hypothetical protein